MDTGLNAWADRELLAELRQLMDADCIVFDVLQGTPPQRKDATHHFVRLLELAERGVNARTK